MDWMVQEDVQDIEKICKERFLILFIVFNWPSATLGMPVGIKFSSVDQD